MQVGMIREQSDLQVCRLDFSVGEGIGLIKLIEVYVETVS